MHYTKLSRITHLTSTHSIQEPKQPQRHFIAKADFNVISCNESVGLTCDLFLSFAFAADFEQPLAVNQEICGFRVVDSVLVADLVQEKRFADSANIYPAKVQSIH